MRMFVCQNMWVTRIEINRTLTFCQSAHTFDNEGFSRRRSKVSETFVGFSHKILNPLWYRTEDKHTEVCQAFGLWHINSREKAEMRWSSSLLFPVAVWQMAAHSQLSVNWCWRGVSLGGAAGCHKGPHIPSLRPGLQKGRRGDGLTGCRPGLRHTIAKLTQERYWGICLFSHPAKPRGIG